VQSYSHFYHTFTERALFEHCACKFSYLCILRLWIFMNLSFLFELPKVTAYFKLQYYFFHASTSKGGFSLHMTTRRKKIFQFIHRYSAPFHHLSTDVEQ
jgi:hypothetical protein